MKSCLFCNTDLCTCSAKIYDRYLYLEDYVKSLKLFYYKSNLTGIELITWQRMYDQGKEELRKIKLLITFKPYENEKPKRKPRAAKAHDRR